MSESQEDNAGKSDELRATNEKLADALDQLKKSQETLLRNERMRALGQMASAVAHDFNNALVPILGFSELLLQNDRFLSNTAETRDMLQAIRDSAASAAESVRLLRDFYRPPDAANEQYVDLAGTVQDAVAFLQSRLRSDASLRSCKIEIKTDIETGIGIKVGKGQLMEIVTSLLNNAADAMQRGGVIGVHGRRNGENRVVLKISDTGTGMDQETIRRCFEPFYTTKGPSSNGLGLAAVYGIVQRLGGHIEAESEQGKGSIFTIVLPCRLLPQSKPAAGSDSPDTLVKTEVATRKSILVIDDEVMILKVLEKVLSSVGHTAELAASGPEGLAKFAKHRPDLVILDRAMPGMGGDEVAKIIREKDNTVPIIVLTGIAGLSDEKANVLPPGADMIIRKPVSLEKLKSAVLEVRRAVPGGN